MLLSRPVTKVTMSVDSVGVRATDTPLTNQDVVELFDYLENALASRACDHSFHITEGFLALNGLDVTRILPWLRKSGATCDCEIVGDFEFNWRKS